MGTFSGMKDAKRGYTSNRLTDGDYVVRVDRCDHFEAEAAGEGYKITLTILASERGAHKEGEAVTATYFLKPGTKGGKKQWFGNIKSFIAVVMGVDDEVIQSGENLLGRPFAERELPLSRPQIDRTDLERAVLLAVESRILELLTVLKAHQIRTVEQLLKAGVDVPEGQ